LTNSIKFTSEGYVKMSTSLVSETSDTVTVEFCVEDSGIGIEEEVKKRLFRPFSQADSSTARRFGGTGLGLTISKNLVDLMRGTIHLDSKLDTGTRAVFTVPFRRVEYQGSSPTTLVEVGSMPDRLPSDLSLSMAGSPRPHSRNFDKGTSPLQSIATANAAGRRSSTTELESARSSSELEIPREKIHILVVEGKCDPVSAVTYRLIRPDNAVNQQIALRFIKALGFSVSAVWNGKEALEYLIKATSPDATPEQAMQHPVPALILMDVQMPILDGYHTTHMLRHHAPFKDIEAIPKIPIVAMTASAIQGDREKCERAGMDDYMAKPVKRSLLESTILKWIFRGRGSRQRRKPSQAGADVQKPSLGRACTDHSSTCTQNDAIVAEFYVANGTSSAEAVTSGNDTPLSTEESGSVSDRAVARRSSISRAILEAEIPGGESENMRATRRAAAEDQARSLRDAKLLSATEADNRHTTTTDFASVPGDDGTYYPETKVPESIPGASPMALTEENIFLLNHAQDDAVPLSSVTPSTSPSSQQHLAYPISDIPGPPPEVTQPAIDLAHVDANAEVLVSSIIQRAQFPPSLQGLSPAESEPAHLKPNLISPKAKSRRDVGGLKPESRQTSTQSVSTARPEKR
jgi:CheY-like chemotaxis protein